MGGGVYSLAIDRRTVHPHVFWVQVGYKKPEKKVNNDNEAR